MIDENIIVTSKSFKNEKVNGLGKINCFFGINGSGKSALANFIRRNSENSLCFDTEYVEKNILLENNDEGLIQGVKLKVGKQVDNELKIKDLKNQISKLVSDNENSQNKSDELKHELYSTLQNTVQEAQEYFKTDKIRQKANANQNPILAYSRWTKGIDTNSKVEFNNISELELKIENLEVKTKDVSKYLQAITNVNFRSLENNLNKVIIKPNSNLSQELLNWLKIGIKLHNLSISLSEEEKEVCLFCGNEFNCKEVANKIIPNINSEYSKAIIYFNNILNQFKRLISEIDIKSFDKLKDLMQRVIIIIEQKIKNTESKVQIPKNITEDFNNSCEKIKSIRDKEINELETLREIKVKTSEYAKEWVGQQLIKNNKCLELKNRIEELTKNINENIEEISSLEGNIKEIKSQQSDLTGFLNICNQKFARIGLRLKLKVDTARQGYLVQEISGIPLQLNDLSEGERRILGFMEFFYQMREDKKSIRKDIDTVIIDDPITSLDAENSYEIVEMINDLIKILNNVPDVKLFIFTNSSQAFHDLGYKNRTVKRWKIKKDLNGESHVEIITPEEFLNRSDYYKEIFIEVAKFAFQSRDELESKNNAVLYCNKARILLESHAYSNYNISNASSSKSNLNALIINYEIPKHMVENFRIDLDIINANSHGFSNIDFSLLEFPVNNLRIQKAIRDIIAVLNCKDSLHVQCMINSLFKGHKDRQKMLEQWSINWKNN